MPAVRHVGHSFLQRRQAMIWLLLGLFLLLVPAWRGHAGVPMEYKLKAVFIYNFLRFVDWPEEESAASGADPLRLCVLGGRRFDAALDSIRGRSAKDRSIQVRFLGRDEIGRDCHVLFIGAALEPRLEAVLSRLRGAAVLTVGDMQGFAQRGGMIGFVVRGGKLRLEVNLPVVRGAGLKISSKLLEIASRIVD